MGKLVIVYAIVEKFSLKQKIYKFREIDYEHKIIILC